MQEAFSKGAPPAQPRARLAPGKGAGHGFSGLLGWPRVSLCRVLRDLLRNKVTDQ